MDELEKDEPREATQDAAATEAAAKPAPKRHRKKKATVGVVVLVVVVLFAGMWVWHEQPSFCSTVCHEPMSSYVEGFYSDDPGLGVSVHANENKVCLSCHEAILTDQVSEAMTWLADDFEMTSDGHIAANYSFASEEFCARSGCHDMDEVVASTWGFEGNDAKYNPHSSHQDLALECGDCHKMHSTSTLVCNKCHNLNVPEGWE